MNALRPADATRTVIGRLVFPVWRGALIILLIAVVPVSIVLVRRARRTDVEKGMTALLDTFESRRLIEPRLSGGFAGGKFDPSASSSAGVRQASISEANDLITDALLNQEAGSRLAYAKLLLSQGIKTADAVKQLRLQLE